MLALKSVTQQHGSAKLKVNSLHNPLLLVRKAGNLQNLQLFST